MSTHHFLHFKDFVIILSAFHTIKEKKRKKDICNDEKSARVFCLFVCFFVVVVVFVFCSVFNKL